MISSMPRILYTVVGIDNKILIDYFDKFGEHITYVTETIIPKINRQGQILWSSNQADYLYVRDNDHLLVLVMLDIGFNKEIALNYIYKIREKLLDIYNIEDLKHIPQHALLDFRNDIRELAILYNANYNDKTKLALDKAITTQNLMAESFANLLERSTKLDSLKDEVNNLSENSVILMRHAVNIRRNVERQQWLAILYFVLLGLGSIFIILYIILMFS